MQVINNTNIMHENMIFMAGGLSYIAVTTVILQGRRRRPAGHGRTTFQEAIKGKGRHLQKFAVIIIGWSRIIAAA